MHTLRHISKRLFIGVRRFSSKCPSDELPLNKVLILKKRTRYELERLKHSKLSDDEFDKLLRKTSTNVDALLYTYKLHQKQSKELISAFINAGFEVDVIDRTQYRDEAIDWADLVVTAGGDGTFLVGASEIKNRSKPLVGFNTNPHKSTGYLCIPSSVNYDTAANLIRKFKFQWRFRSRIEIRLTGRSANEEPEVIGIHPDNSYRTLYDQCAPITSRILPSMALNEVFLSERRPSHVSNLIVSVPGVPKTHVKCSGVCVSTGTGSTSWHMSMNGISFAKVHKLFKLAKVDFPPEKLLAITSQFNDSLQFPYDDPRIFYTIRDLIYSPITPNPSGLPAEAFTPSITLVSKCVAASLVIDGTHAWTFNEGTIADLSSKPEIALRTIHL